MTFIIASHVSLRIKYNLDQPILDSFLIFTQSLPNLYLIFNNHWDNLKLIFSSGPWNKQINSKELKQDD